MMRVKDGYLLRKIAGSNVVLPMNSDLELNRMITLNDTGAFLWSLLQQENEEEDLVKALLAEYEVDEATAAAAVKGFAEKLRENELLA